MAQGVPVEKQYTTSDISDAIIKYNGMITHVAHHLGLSREGLYQHLTKHPDLWDLIDNKRKEGAKISKAWACERAFHTMQKLAEKSDQFPSTSLKASMYILDNMDDHLGCKKKTTPQDNQEEVEIKYEGVMNQLERNRKELESKNGNE